jgi:hypothetical protein
VWRHVPRHGRRAVHSRRRGKLVERDRLLDGLGLRGIEELLAVGCGRGLLARAAVRRRQF